MNEVLREEGLEKLLEFLQDVWESDNCPEGPMVDDMLDIVKEYKILED